MKICLLATCSPDKKREWVRGWIKRNQPIDSKKKLMHRYCRPTMLFTSVHMVSCYFEKQSIHTFFRLKTNIMTINITWNVLTDTSKWISPSGFFLHDGVWNLCNPFDFNQKTWTSSLPLHINNSIIINTN